MEKLQVSTVPIANTDCTTTEHSTQTVLAMFLGFRKPLHSCIEVMFHTSTRPGTSLHVTQAFPRVSTASNKRLVRRSGYKAMPCQFLY